jgi:hypothetical protein
MSDDGKLEVEARSIIEMFMLSCFLNARGEHPEWLAADSHELMSTLWQGGFKIVKRDDYAECAEMRAHMAEYLEDYKADAGLLVQ